MNSRLCWVWIYFKLCVVVHSFIPSAQQNQVDIQLDYDENIPLEVEGDPFRLNQILFNLIKNAIKFGKNGRVIVSIKLVSIEVNQAKIRFNVIDNGIGIASVEVDKIFKSFSHANEAIMENYGGSGIGLSIIKNLLVLMNSEIQLKSEPGKGSLFYFTRSVTKGKMIPIPKRVSPIVFPKNKNELKTNRSK